MAKTPPPAIEEARKNGDPAHFDLWIEITKLQERFTILMLLALIILAAIAGLYFA